MPAPCGVELWSCMQQALCVHQSCGEPFLGFAKNVLEGAVGQPFIGFRMLESASELQGQVAVGYGSGSLDQVRLGEAFLHAMIRRRLPT